MDSWGVVMLSGQ